MTAGMIGKIFQLEAEGKLLELDETPFELENALQTLLAAHPDLLPGDQMDPESPRRWLLLDREVAIPGDVANWALDHLFVDQDGIPTLVEVKRGSNPELRRKVVGQMLDYAANAPISWPPGSLRALFEARCSRERLQPDAELSTAFGEGISPESFWRMADENLADRKLRLLFVTDRMVPELRRVVEFLNDQMKSVDVLAVEVRQYRGGDRATLVPTIFGQSLASEAKKARRGLAWTAERFCSEIRKLDSGAEAIARDLLAWSEIHATQVFWGKGTQTGSFGPIFRIGNRDAYPFLIWTYGSVEIQFQYLQQHPPFDEATVREELRQKLNRIELVAIPEGKIDKRPSIPISVFADPGRRAEFKCIVLEVVEAIRAAAGRGQVD